MDELDSQSPSSLKESSRSPLDWPGEIGIGRELAHDIRLEVRRRKRRRLRIGGAVAVALIFSGVALRLVQVSPNSDPVTATARVIGPERRLLPDGSVMDVRPGALVRVDFDPVRRRIELMEGEAHFKVMKDSSRPFVVFVRNIAVSAVGTEFSVGRGQDDIEVVVTEGMVEVGCPETSVSTGSGDAGEKPSNSVLLAAGDRILVDRRAPQLRPEKIDRVSPVDLRQNQAWRIPRIEFYGASLGEVVRLFNAHGRVRLQVADSTIENVRVSGVLRADNVDALLDLLRMDHAIEADIAEGTIVLRRR